MSELFQAFWRAVTYCLHPKVILLSFLPLLVMGLVTSGLAYFFWEPGVSSVNAWLLSSDWLVRSIGWLEAMGLGGLKAAIAPLLIVAMVTPLIVIGSLLMVALLMMPAIVKLVAQRRFPTLEARHGASFAAGVLWSLGAVAMAIGALVVSVPLWFIPPLALIVPPLVWGWLTTRVMAYDALSLHASKVERKEIFKRYRWPLLSMGVIAGYLGTAPALLWVSGVMFVVFAPVFLLAAIWIYTLVFAFAALWFSHFCLAALLRLRSEA